MKFRVTFKDPDGVFEAIQEAAIAQAKAIPELNETERDLIAEQREKELSMLCQKWCEYGEYLTVEIDTDAGTCVVVPVNE